VRTAADGKPRVDQTAYTYGTCTPTDDAGCVAPLEIDTAPLCEFHLALYDPTDPHQDLVVDGVPAEAFDNGQILEIYTGNTTIKISSTIVGLPAQIAFVLTQSVSLNVPASGRSWLTLPASDAASPVP
jgi:hypothetical protein